MQNMTWNIWLIYNYIIIASVYYIITIRCITVFTVTLRKYDWCPSLHKPYWPYDRMYRQQEYFVDELLINMLKARKTEEWPMTCL